MHTLLIIRSGCNIAIFCPMCHEFILDQGGDIEYEDYINDSCLYWCPNCREVLICPTGDNRRHGDGEFEQMERGVVPVSLDDRQTRTRCIQLLSRAQAAAEYPHYDLVKAHEVIDEDIDDADVELGDMTLDKYFPTHYYSVGIMRITHIIGANDPQWDAHPEDADREELLRVGKVQYNEPTPAVTCFGALKENIDTTHDGCHLYYRAICTECGREAESSIWGD